MSNGRLFCTAAFAIAAIVACTRTKTEPLRVADAAADVGSVPAPVADAGTTFALRDIPLPRVPGRAPIKVEGYPAPLAVGMSDAAEAFGYLSDGKSFAYCQYDVCCMEGFSWCDVYDEHDAKTVLTAEKGVRPGRDGGTTMTDAELRAFPAKEGLQRLDLARKMAPPPRGDLLYGDEITVVVRETPPLETAPFTMGSVRIGGKIAGEPPVFVVFPQPDKFCSSFTTACFEVQLNDLAVSPAGDEMVFLIYARGSSHGSSFAHHRMSAARFAGAVFNDTGMLHHKKKEWARAAELFTRAVYADPAKELFAYNLACALARQSDPRAEHALRHAASLGGEAVQKRAVADADFDAVKAAPWFESVTRR